MNPSEEENTLKELIKVASTTKTIKDFVAVFKVAVAALGDLKQTVLTQTQKQFSTLKDTIVKDVNDIKGQLGSKIEVALKEQEISLNFLRDKVRSLKDGYTPVKGVDYFDGTSADEEKIIAGVLTKIPPDVEETAIETRDKLESLEGDERLDASAIRNLPEATKAIAEAIPGWGAHPLTIQGLGITIDENTRFINFKGAGLSSVTRSVDGIVEVTIAGASGAGTQVLEETPADSGDHTNFTLAHTPLTGTLLLYRGGARQQSIGLTPDFTLSSATITLTTVLQTGEVLLATYQY